MVATPGDLEIAAAAAGFSLGFGFLTALRAYKQTKANRCPARSAYVYMIWGEIFANLVLGILVWLYLNDVVKTTPIFLVCILTFYALEVQLLMQIIINRIAIITERRPTALRMKIATAVIISIINILVFCIFIPSHMDPPVSETYTLINKYWDRTSKILIMIVDAFLNWYFIHVVQGRLVKYHGLRKYKPLVGYYIRLGIVSIAMDVMLIALMSLPNQVLFVQFHPVAYMVKLNIEMSMADMIVKVATSSETDVVRPSSSYPRPSRDNALSEAQRTILGEHDTHDIAQNNATTVRSQTKPLDRQRIRGISCKTEVRISVGDLNSNELCTKQDDKGVFESHIPLQTMRRVGS